jgi:hypothetical protein
MSTSSASTGGGEKPQVRASDAERDAALRALAGHYADGRLDRAEFDERADAAFAARTRDELGTLLRDLPRPAAELAQPRGGGWPARSAGLSDRADPAGLSNLFDLRGRADLSDRADRADLSPRADARPRSAPSLSRPHARPFGPIRVAAPLVLLVPVLLALALAAVLHGVPPFPLIPLFFLLTRVLLIPTRRPRRWHREAPPWI